MGDISKQQERRLERKIIDGLNSSCAFVARMEDTPQTESDVLDIVCIQDKKLKHDTRLIASDYEGNLEVQEREDIKQIAEEVPDHVRTEVHYRPSPRKSTKRTVSKSGWSEEKIADKVEEFNHNQLER